MEIKRSLRMDILRAIKKHLEFETIGVKKGEEIKPEQIKEVLLDVLKMREGKESSDESAALPLHDVSGMLPFTEVLELNICIEKLNTKQITLEEFASDVWNTAYRVGYDMASEQ